jgi:hypothetical protein
MSRAMQFDIVANDKATGTMRSTESSMDKFTSRIGTNFTRIAIKAALAMAVMNKLKGVFSEGGDIEDGARRMGVTNEAFQRATTSAGFFGVTVQDLIKMFKDLNVVMDEAATKGKGDQFQALKALGFSDQEIMNREIQREQILIRLGEAMAAVNDEAQKYAIASRVLGAKTVVSVMPILDDPQGFLRMYKEAKVLTDEQVRNLAKSDDFLDNVGNKAKNVFQQGVAGLASMFTDDKPADAPAAITDDARARARALLGTGAQVEKGDTDKGGGLAVTSLQEIGGGLGKGINIADLFAERTAQATETIAAVVTASPAPAPSATDITKPSEQSSSVATPSTSAPSSTIKNMSNAFFRGRSPF